MNLELTPNCFPERATDQNIRTGLAMSKELITNNIRKLFATCYPDLIHQTKPDDRWRLCDVWIDQDGNSIVRALWSVERNKKNHPNVSIEALTTKEKNRGRAANFLKCIVAVLQEDKDPDAKIELEAWTGGNSYYGEANGAYTWAKLGFDMEDKAKSLFDTGFPEWSEKLEKSLLTEKKSHLWRVFYNTSIDMEDKWDSIVTETISELKKCKYPWEVASLNVQQFAIGTFLMSEVRESRYWGELLPNTDSPGMVQYNKRMTELQAKYK
jgi:hypothetical protein